MDAIGALLALLHDNPSVAQGFVGGLIAAILVDIVHWRWQVVRRRHNGKGEA
jgi:hypothetical protein